MQEITNNLACTVILYNPGNSFLKNILSYSYLFKKVFIIDNSETNLKDLKKVFKSFSNIETFQDGVNKGIGERLNFAISQTIDNGYDWLLTMDQDSRFTQQNLEAYIKTIATIEKSKKISQVGIEYFYEEKQPEKNIILRETTHVITSGTFINLRAISVIGLLREDLFIDEVDTEFSYRTIEKGWKNFVCIGVYIIHNLGEKVTAYSFKNLQKSGRTLHAPIRIYYITRNYLFVKKMYKKLLPSTFKQRDKTLLNTFKNNLFYNKEKIKILKMIIRGYVDFKKDKLGKFVE